MQYFNFHRLWEIYDIFQATWIFLAVFFIVWVLASLYYHSTKELRLRHSVAPEKRKESK